MTTYLILGAGGMLGRDLQASLADREVTALDRANLDITDPTATAAAVNGHDVILNASGYTRVDDAESHEPDAFRVNAAGAANIARAARKNGSTMVHFSTDYVFDGTATSPYSEDAALHPVSAYGRSKADGERLVAELNPDATYIVRTAWLYGEHGSSFPKTMLRLAKERETVSVVADQIGQPTWTADLAQQVRSLLDSGAPRGIYHGTNSGLTSWYEFARVLFEIAGLDPDRVKPTDSSQFIRPAPRPAYSVLGHDAWGKVGLAPMREWESALRDAFTTGALKPE